MTEKRHQLYSDVQRAVSEGRTLCYMTRAKELQEEACIVLGKLHEQAGHVRAEAVRTEVEDTANCSLALEYVLSAVIEELRMWIALKEDRTSAAWDRLVDSQMAIHNAFLAHQIAQQFEGYPTHLATLETVLFPPLMFMSAGMTAKRCEFSICGADYDECDHILGRPYMGKLCHRIIRAARIEEVSFVPDPANKHCRVYTIAENGVSRDVLTGRVQPTGSATDVASFASV
jgi:hypothetical protein